MGGAMDGIEYSVKHTEDFSDSDSSTFSEDEKLAKKVVSPRNKKKQKRREKL